jgi:hypothetical protein
MVMTEEERLGSLLLAWQEQQAQGHHLAATKTAW